MGDLRADAGNATKTHVGDARGIDDQQADHDALRRHGRRLEPEFRIDVAIMDGSARKRTQDTEDLETKTDGPGTSGSRCEIVADIVEFVAFSPSGPTPARLPLLARAKQRNSWVYSPPTRLTCIPV